MAGTPGKGGQKGRSGRTSIGPVYRVCLPPDLHAIAKREGPDWVRAAIREKAS